MITINILYFIFQIENSLDPTEAPECPDPPLFPPELSSQALKHSTQTFSPPDPESSLLGSLANCPPHSKH